MPRSTSPTHAPTPLHGIRVVDLSQNLAGPFATQILADLGADVIKVEPPGGDAARQWGPPFVDGESPLFLCANRNKRSVVLDLTEERDRNVVRRLVAGADVFLQAFRSGVIERLGFGRPEVRKLSPRIIYVSVTAFGEEGPRREDPGYDPLMQAFSGLMSVTGHADRPPARVGTSVVDLGTGMWTALAVLAALRTRESTGEGSHVTASLLDTSLAWMGYHLQGFLGGGVVPGPLGSALGMIAPYQAFPASDGYLMIAAGNDATFRRLCGALDLDALADDPRYATNPDRVGNRDTLVEAVAARTRALPLAELERRLREAAVPNAPIQDVGQVVQDPQVRASGMLRRIGPDVDRIPPSGRADGAAGDSGSPAPEGLPDIAMPVRWSGRRPGVRRPPPGLGEHTEDVLRELATGEWEE